MESKELIKKIKSFPALSEFMKSIEMSKDLIKKHHDFLEEFLTGYQECGPGKLEDCLQHPKGYQPFLEWNHQMFYAASRHCQHWISNNKNYAIKKNFIYSDYNIDDNPLTLYAYKQKVISEEVVDPSRLKYIELVTGIIEKKRKKGLFLSGLPGVGKTYLLQLTANQFALNHQVAFIAVPNLIKTIKDGFSNDELKKENLLRTLMHVDYLFLDDIGGEVVSAYSRDEILFTLLNYRMENKKTTFFSANFKIEKLNILYGTVNINSTDEEIIETRTRRFTDRIKGLADEIMIKGENKRY